MKNQKRINSFLKLVLSHVRGTLIIDDDIAENPVVIDGIAN